MEYAIFKTLSNCNKFDIIGALVSYYFLHFVKIYLTRWVLTLDRVFVVTL